MSAVLRPSCYSTDIFLRWTDQNFVPIRLPASTSCVRLTPDNAGTYTEDDPLPEGRSMGVLIALPNGKILCLNGAGLGKLEWFSSHRVY